MNCKSLLFCACFASLLSSTPAATVIKILHINPQAKVRVIWQESAQGFESAHPGVKVEFDYLENEAFKAKLPTLLQSKDRPSIFHSWGGGVMVEQIGSGICQNITVPATDLAYYEEATSKWRIEPIWYTAIVGRHALDPNALRTDFRVV